MPAQSWKDLMNKAEEGAKEFAILDEGMYSFVVKEPAKIGETSKGNPKWTINPSVESGPRANARVFHDFIVSDSAFAMKNFFFGDLAVLGLNASFFDTNPSEQAIAQALQGRRFVAEVFHEKGNNGKTYARLRNFAEPTTAPPGAGVPGGLPVASAPAPVQAAGAPSPQIQPQQAAQPVTESPWGTPAPAPVQGAPLMPPSFG